MYAYLLFNNFVLLLCKSIRSWNSVAESLLISTKLTLLGPADT